MNMTQLCPGTCRLQETVGEGGDQEASYKRGHLTLTCKAGKALTEHRTGTHFRWREGGLNKAQRSQGIEMLNPPSWQMRLGMWWEAGRIVN